MGQSARVDPAPNPILTDAHPLVLMLMGFSVTAVISVVVAAVVWRRRRGVISYWDGKVQRGVPIAPQPPGMVWPPGEGPPGGGPRDVGGS